MNTRFFWLGFDRPVISRTRAAGGGNILISLFFTRIKIRAEGACQNDSINVAFQHPLQIPLKILHSFRFFLRHVRCTCCVHGTTSLPSLFHQHPVFCCWLSHRLETQNGRKRGLCIWIQNFHIPNPAQPNPPFPFYCHRWKKGGEGELLLSGLPSSLSSCANVTLLLLLRNHRFGPKSIGENMLLILNNKFSIFTFAVNMCSRFNIDILQDRYLQKDSFPPPSSDVFPRSF